MFRSPGKLLLTLLMVVLASSQLAWILLKDTEIGQQYLEAWGFDSESIPQLRHDAMPSAPPADNSGASNSSDAASTAPESDKHAETSGLSDSLFGRDGNWLEPPGTKTANPNKDGLVRRIAAISVRVEAVDADGEGCGVIVAIEPSSYDVLTAAHVIEGSQRFLVTVFEELSNSLIRSPRQDRSVSVVNVDRDRDLALLRVFGPNSFGFEPALMANATVDPSSLPLRGWVIDSLSEDWPEVRTAKVVERRTVARTKEAIPIRYLILQSASESGMSGGGLFDSSGRLIGIASGNGDGRAFYIATNEIQAFVRRN